jgi:S-adenosylmethionine-diacylglycerol 3-amino-3-carboxypropyl transferase
MHMGFFNWLSGRSFNLVHRHNLVYNTCWEDPRLDRVALDLQPDDVLLTITSGGCNVLDYVLQEPRKVIAVDINPRQNALLELKIAGIRKLDFERFFELFGRGRLADFPHVYEHELRDALTPASRRWWDRHLHFFDGSGRRSSFYFRGTTGYFAWLLNGYIDRVAHVRDAIEAVLAAQTVEEQRVIYEAVLHGALWRKLVRWLLRRDYTLSLLGVPRPQRQQLERDYSGGVCGFIEDSLRAVFAYLPLRDNYFWRVYLTGQYTPDCCPDYLLPANFERLKGGLVDRISIHHTSVTGYLEKHEEPISRFVLLDHMDWLSSLQTPLLEQEWQAIIHRAAPHARMLWRSAGQSSTFIDRVEVQLGKQRKRVGDLIRYNRQLAAYLHPLDRVHTYGSFFIANVGI